MKDRFFKGVRLLFIGELFAILATGAIVVKIPGVPQGLAFLGFAGIVAFILQLIAMFKLRPVNSQLGSAFWFTILGLIASIVAVVLPMCIPENLIVARVCGGLGIFSRVVTIFITMFVIQGIGDYFASSGDKSRAASGRGALVLYALAILAVAIIEVLLMFDAIGGNQTVATILAIVALVAEIFAYLVYLIYLAKSLRKN